MPANLAICGSLWINFSAIVSSCLAAIREILKKPTDGTRPHSELVRLIDESWEGASCYGFCVSEEIAGSTRQNAGWRRSSFSKVGGFSKRKPNSLWMTSNVRPRGWSRHSSDERLSLAAAVPIRSNRISNSRAVASSGGEKSMSFRGLEDRLLGYAVAVCKTHHVGWLGASVTAADV